MKPAARLTDLHTCPMFDGPKPHVGGPVTGPCAPTVQVGMLLQARILDLATCVGPPDPLSQGASTILVGGMPPSALGDMTSHGGVITVGLPTVLLGGPAVTLQVAPNQTTAFVDALRAALSTILPTRSGIEWLRQMGLNARAVAFIELHTVPQNSFAQADDGANQANGVGSNVTISWDPTMNTLDPSLPGPQGSPGAAVVLAHEMVHGLHFANGDDRNGPNDSFPGQNGSSARNEERSTVGTAGPITRPDGTVDNSAPDYSHDVPTENSFRDDLGIPRRPGYFPGNWPGGAPW